MSVLKTGIQLTHRGLLITILLNLTFLTWYYIVPLSLLPQVAGSSPATCQMAFTAYHLIIATTLIVCSGLIHKFNEITIIYECSIAIVITISLLLVVSNVILRLILLFVEAIFFSLGQLASLTYFWNLTIPEERGRVAGLTGFFVILLSYLVGQLAQTLDLGEMVGLSVALSVGILMMKVLKPEKKALLTTKKEDREYRPEKRTILLYAIPWILFCSINITLASTISLNVSQRVPPSLYMVLLVLQMTASGFGALGGGIVADFIGRRLTLGFSLTLYGISMALGGLADNYMVFYFMYAANGLNWGILWALYGLVIWGDLADREKCAKRYASGLIIVYLTTGVGILLSDHLVQTQLVISSLVSCLLIFLSNIPLILAPELLSSDFREKIKFKFYKSALKKIARKPSQNQG